NRLLLRLLILQTIFAVVYLQSTVALPLSVQVRGLAPETLGYVLGASAVTMIAAQPLLGVPRVAAMSPAARLTLGFLVMAGGLSGFAVAAGAVTLVLSAMLVALGDLLLLGQLMTMASTLAPPESRARYLAVFGSSWGFASVLAPVAGTV